MSLNITTLKKVYRNHNDEFYTTREQINDMFFYFNTQDKFIYMPCDAEWSEFVKYFEETHLCKGFYHTSDDFRKHEEIFKMCKRGSDCYIVTNPPFSQLSKGFLKMLSDNDCNFCIIAPVSCLTYKDTVPHLGKDWFARKMKNTCFKNDNSKAYVPCIYLSSEPLLQDTMISKTHSQEPLWYDKDTLLCKYSYDAIFYNAKQYLVPGSFFTFKESNDFIILNSKANEPMINNKSYFKKLLVKRKEF